MTISSKATKDPTELPVGPEAENLPSLWATILLLNDYESMSKQSNMEVFLQNLWAPLPFQSLLCFLRACRDRAGLLVRLTPSPFENYSALATSLTAPIAQHPPPLPPALQRSLQREMGCGRGAAKDQLPRQTAAQGAGQVTEAGFSSVPLLTAGQRCQGAGARNAMQIAGLSDTAGLKGSAVCLFRLELNHKAGFLCDTCKIVAGAFPEKTSNVESHQVFLSRTK